MWERPNLWGRAKTLVDKAAVLTVLPGRGGGNGGLIEYTTPDVRALLKDEMGEPVVQGTGWFKGGFVLLSNDQERRKGLDENMLDMDWTWKERPTTPVLTSIVSALAI